MNLQKAKAPLRVPLACCLFLGGVVALAGCGDEPVAAQRGMGGAGKGKKKPPPQGGPAAKTPSGDGEDEVDEGPERPPLVLDEKSFTRRRDPFRAFVVTERSVPEPDSPRASRKVKLGQYTFEDLRLVIIVNSGRGIQPRAQFVGGDGRSGTVLQGEYFSSAEVLLAAVNRDYVEVEVVDEELAGSLGLRRGERRTIFLRDE